MNEVWNLNPIYNGFDDPAFATDLNTLKEKVAQAATLSENLEKGQPLEMLKRGIALEETVTALVCKLAVYANLRQSANTRDAEAGSQIGRIMSAYSDFAGPAAAFHAWAAALPDLMELVNSGETLKDYRFLFEKMKENSRYLLPGRGEEIMARMGLSGGSAWAEMQQYLTSTVPVSYRGGITNLSAIRNLAYDPDPQVRKEAWEAELACYETAAVADVQYLEQAMTAYYSTSLEATPDGGCTIR